MHAVNYHRQPFKIRIMSSNEADNPRVISTHIRQTSEMYVANT